MALPRGAIGLSADCVVVFPDHTHLLFYIQLSFERYQKEVSVAFYSPSVYINSSEKNLNFRED